MNKLTVPAFFLVFATTGSAFAGEEVDETLEASADGLVEIINTRGEIEISGWDRQEISVVGELDDQAERLVFEVDGDRALIEVEMPRSVNWGDGSDLVINVPEGSRVKFEGVSTDVSLENIAGGIKVNTASGDIDADQIQQFINIKSVSGDIEVGESSGQTNVSTVSGEIELDVASTKANINAVSGDVDARLGSFDRLSANIVSGDIEIEGSLVEAGSIDITSVSGDVSLELAPPVDAEVSIQTGPGGDITNRLSDHAVKDKFPATKSLHAKLGMGTGDIELRTVSGDIELDEID